MGAYRFSMAPNISVPRSKFRMPFNHATSFNHGKLVPIDCFEILPGDEFKCDFSAIIRMSTPIAPIFGNIKAHVHAFFIPMRLVWNHTKEFYGENKTSAGYQQQSFQIPGAALGIIDENQVSSYLGKPVITSDGNESAVVVSVLKERCYYLVYNEYYRAQQLQNPVLLVEDDTGGIGTITNNHGTTDILQSGIITFANSPLMNVCKQFDYFTAMTTAPQYGASVTLPLGSTAPLIVGSSMNSLGGSLKLGNALGTGATGTFIGPRSDGVTISSMTASDSQGVQVTPNTSSGYIIGSTNLLADLSNATAASINSIRYAFQVQKWLERANFGSRFFEMLNLHYGVTSPDARLQRPEYLGGMDFYINVDQVIATASGQNGSGEDSGVGQTGAVSVTGIKNKNLFNKAFVEPGYVLVLISTTHERTYSQGIRREDSRADRFDFYFPEFANLGDQAVKSKEIFYGNSSLANEDANLGYQEHWAEYRYRPNQVSGKLNPNVQNSMDYWTLAEKFASRPTLSNSFIMEDRNALTRALVSGASGPDYIADFYFNYTAIREMPLYTIPGLVDHFGVM